MSYQVKFLTEEEVKAWDGWYDPDRNYLGIYMDGKLTSVHVDYGEPEDNSFGRDWAWVAHALESAYEKGFNDGMWEE